MTAELKITAAIHNITHILYDKRVIVFYFFDFSVVLRQLTNLDVCSSTQWCKPECCDCHHCFRIVVNHLTIDAAVKKRKGKTVNYHKQRRRLIRLYRGTRVLDAMYRVEVRVLNSLGVRV